MSMFKRVKETLSNHPIYYFTLVFLLLLVILSLAAPLIPIDPKLTDVGAASQTPSLRHIFGTDEVGRDYFIRVIYGGRISLLVGILAMITSVFIGTIIGIAAGFVGGWLDDILMRIVDVLSAIPWMVLVIVLSVFLKPGLSTLVIVIGGFSWMSIARLLRAETMAAKEREYVEYAQFIGESQLKLILRHVLPQILPTMIVAATMSISSAIMTESALSFLGLGIQQPNASWGSLLQNAQSSLQRAPYMAILPGIFVALTVFSFNQLGDFLRVILLREDEKND
ncbi:ABC transporter permease [Enterococcus mediterraneensis]|uniref:ABC transporter permease n=1 Tax=Enterococcus mediterraneensis TaxID=2364791 RepID=UPI0019D2B4A5|nr:ABC transporter permease [Enterococcus mediterraneensis]